MIEFDDAERLVVDTALRERYGERVGVELAEAELQLDPAEATLTACSTLFWEQRGAAFALVKAGQARYRAMFFYPDDPLEEQFGAGKAEYKDLLECVTTLLRSQADHEKERKGVYSGKTGRELRGTIECDDFDADRDPEEDPDAR